jgi:hypothetical protein
MASVANFSARRRGTKSHGFVSYVIPTVKDNRREQVSSADVAGRTGLAWEWCVVSVFSHLDSVLKKSKVMPKTNVRPGAGWSSRRHVFVFEPG